MTGGVPPYTYNWSDGNTAPDLFNLTVGTYTVTVRTVMAVPRLKALQLLPRVAEPAAARCISTSPVADGCGANCSGGISLTVVGGILPYTYDWNNDGPETPDNDNRDLFGICQGTFCVTVTDAGGVATSGCATVPGSPLQYLDIQSTNAAFCNYNDNADVTLCEKVCPNSTVTYFVEPPSNCGSPLNIGPLELGNSGRQSKTFLSQTEVSVTWGDAGPGVINIGQDTLCFQGSRCVTIVEEPVATFTTNPPTAPNTTLQLCKGQTVAFINESLHAEQYEWTFSDNLVVLADENPEHTFLSPGNFTVTLIARSNCLCADTTVLLIEVLDTEPPLLDCVGSVCPGETVKYSTSSNCSSYAWAVSPNGTIVDGGNASDNSITVQWGQGPSGSISLSATGCGGAACPQASVFKIPIISDNAEIRGDESVCPDSEEEYSIDQFDGTEYTWTLSSGGIIRTGQGTNKVSVGWIEAPNVNTTHWLMVDYYNCYLGCGGQDSIPVKILPPFFVNGKVELCEQSTTLIQRPLQRCLLHPGSLPTGPFVGKTGW